MNGGKASVIWYWPCRINWAWEHVCGSPSVSNQGFSMGKWRGAYRAALPPLHCTLLHIQYMQPNVSVQLSHSVMSNSLWHNELQHTRPPCPSLTPGAHPNPCPLSRWCLLAISSSISLLLPSIFPSFRVFSNEPAFLIRWPKYWSFSFNISLSNEHPGLNLL